MRFVVYIDIFEEKVSKITKELVRASVPAMGFGRKGILPKVFL